MPTAVSKAKEYIAGAIEAGKEVYIGHGSGPLNHFYAPVTMKTVDSF